MAFTSLSNMNVEHRGKDLLLHESPDMLTQRPTRRFLASRNSSNLIIPVNAFCELNGSWLHYRSEELQSYFRSFQNPRVSVKFGPFWPPELVFMCSKLSDSAQNPAMNQSHSDWIQILALSTSKARFFLHECSLGCFAVVGGGVVLVF